MNIDYAINLLNVFRNNGSKAYLVGGSVRDYLIKGNFDDFDFATSSKTNEIIHILNVDKYDHFAAKFGTIKTNYLNQDVEITTFRKESDYLDFRRPSKIEFIDSIEIDSNRRDFTINALYMDENKKIYDFHNGLKDIENKAIKMIGNPMTRINEDPVRILRAIRFALSLNFTIDNDLDKAIIDSIKLLDKISQDRISSEYHKMLKVSDKDSVDKMLAKYNLFLKE